MKLAKLFKLNNRFTSSSLMGLAITLLVTGLIMVSQPPQPTQATMDELTAAEAQYSNIVGTALDACGLCHTATFSFNSYGQAYKSASKNFAAIEGQDSDGDGFTNLEEIMALTFPGDPASKPAAPTPTPPPADTPTPPPADTPTPPPVAGEVVVSVSGPDSVAVGNEFDVKIMAQGADASSAIYGAQFKLNFDSANLEVVADTLQPGAAMSPHVIGLSEVDNSAGLAQLAYSRQGDVEGLTGDVVVATLRFRTISATDGTTLSLAAGDLILGTKEAVSIPINSTNDLTVIITDQGDGTKAVVSGNVSLPGKTDHTGATVSMQGTSFSGTTDSSGNYSISDVDEGTYIIEAVATGHLRAVCADKSVTAPTTELNAVSLLAGDLNGDDAIDITDATTIGVDFGTSESRSDLNGDGTVNVLDLILLAQNYDTSGPSNWSC